MIWQTMRVSFAVCILQCCLKSTKTRDRNLCPPPSHSFELCSIYMSESLFLKLGLSDYEWWLKLGMNGRG